MLPGKATFHIESQSKINSNIRIDPQIKMYLNDCRNQNYGDKERKERSREIMKPRWNACYNITGIIY